MLFPMRISSTPAIVKFLFLSAAFGAQIVTAGAQTSSSSAFTGTWVMQLGQRNLLVLELHETGGMLSGSMARPAKYSNTNGLYANIRGAIRHDPIAVMSTQDGVLHVIEQNANNPKDADRLVMFISGDSLSVAWDDLPTGVIVAPRVFKRTASDVKVATDWEPNRVYTSTDADTPSEEMNAIYTEDQRVRTAASIDWKAVNRTDTVRREQTRKLLASDALHTGKDYEEASFVFQHGNTAEDYLLAHTLAIIAVSKGDSTAAWIASATMDRYLEKIGQKQVFGTQFSHDVQHGWTQEPYDRGFISDALREQLGVPTQAEQAEQLNAYAKQQQ
jgi:hypothetical protein